MKQNKTFILLALVGVVGSVLLIIKKQKNINLWVQVVDQYSNPVEEVKINYGGTSGYLNDGSDSDYLLTDDNGLGFTKGAYGNGLSMWGIEKRNYVFRLDNNQDTPEQRINIYGRSKKDHQNYWGNYSKDIPFTIVIWKKEAESQVKTGERLFAGIPDGRLYFLDFDSKLYARQVDEIEKAGMYIRFERSETDWTATINYHKGGLIETTDQYMFEAPDSGYYSTVKKEGDGQSWQNYYDFYIYNQRAETYSRYHIKLMPFFNDKYAAVRIWYVTNYKGERNLYDENI
ncbi:MAG: hypothetical protein HWE27_11770 [Gammaproteobacteria bacterium]|nr:hypothetical protein [Gammaproteobacteria bacterium]